MHRVDAGDSELTLLIDQAARRLGVCRRTVYYKIQSGELQTIRTLGGSQRVLTRSIDELKRARERLAEVRGGGVAREVGSDAESLPFQVEALA